MFNADLLPMLVVCCRKELLGLICCSSAESTEIQRDIVTVVSVTNISAE